MHSVHSASTSKAGNLLNKLEQDNFHVWYDELLNHVGTFGEPGKEVKTDIPYDHEADRPIKATYVDEDVQDENGNITIVRRDWTKYDSSHYTTRVEQHKSLGRIIADQRTRLWSYLHSNITADSWTQIQMEDTFKQLREDNNTLGLIRLIRQVHMSMSSQSLTRIRKKVAAMKQVLHRYQL